MLKNLIFIVFVVLICSIKVNAQGDAALKVNVDYIHQFVYELHQDQTKNFILNNEERVKEMKVFLDKNMYFIQYKNIPSAITEKLSSYRPVNPAFVQEKFDLKSFNPFLYGFEKLDMPKKIHIDGTNYVLFINPSIK